MCVCVCVCAFVRALDRALFRRLNFVGGVPERVKTVRHGGVGAAGGLAEEDVLLELGYGRTQTAAAPVVEGDLASRKNSARSERVVLAWRHGGGLGVWGRPRRGARVVVWQATRGACPGRCPTQKARTQAARAFPIRSLPTSRRLNNE